MARSIWNSNNLDMLNRACWYTFLVYMGCVAVFCVYSLLHGFFNDNIGVINPYKGRAEMYLDYMRD